MISAEKNTETKYDKSIQSWLQERQSLILLLCAVYGLKEYTPQITPLKIKLQAFCQLLIDYICAGHFEIYEHVAQHAENTGNHEVRILLDKYYPRIKLSTDLALDFNDTYNLVKQTKDAKIQQLLSDLSILAEKLEERFTIEDLLIEKLNLSP